jgi:dTDP-glucose pyrophosphorylase
LNNFLSLKRALDDMEEWKKALLPINSTIGQAIRNLEESALQIAVVVDGEATLIGTITDGDIRRGMLRGLSLDAQISQILNSSPLVVPVSVGRSLVLQLMRANKVRQLPAIDEAGKVVGLHLLDELMVPSSRENTMVIMAGGKGVRLRPYTENCPKPLLPIDGRPILEHIIERAKVDGIHHFVISVHYLGHMIEKHFGDGTQFGVRIDYLREPAPLGTAGALSLFQPVNDLPILISNGDVLTDIRYGDILEFHRRHEAIATMAVRLHEWQNPFGVVHTKGVDITEFEEKPTIRSHINAGIYVIEPKSLAAIQHQEQCDMPELFDRLRNKGFRTIVYPLHEPWIDVGRVDDLEKARSNHETAKS